MKKTGILLITAVLLILPAQSRAMVEVAIGAWDQNIEGDMSYALYGRTPDQVDLERDLDLEDDLRGVGYLKLELPILPSLYLGFTPMEFEGDGQMDQPFVFGDYVFKADRPLDSHIKLNHFDVGLYYSLHLRNVALVKKAKVDLGVNLRTAELDVSVTGTVADAGGGELRVREAEDYTLPIPMLYGAVQLTPVDNISLEFEGRGVTLSSDHLFSLLGKIKFRLTESLFVAAGYRYDDIRLDEDNLDIDSSVGGVFCETGFEF